MEKEKKNEAFIYIRIIVGAIFLGFIITTYLCMPIRVKGNSMSDNIRENDIGFSFYYDLNALKRFNVVIFNNNGEKNLIKRLIGLPNETIEYKDNKLYVNGEYVKEDFLDKETYTSDIKITLKENEVFCLGDNRENSTDSRVFGPVSIDNLVSAHIFILFPFDRIGFIQ